MTASQERVNPDGIVALLASCVAGAAFVMTADNSAFWTVGGVAAGVAAFEAVRAEVRERRNRRR